jgi:hypothetical protein
MMLKRLSDGKLRARVRRRANSIRQTGRKQASLTLRQRQRQRRAARAAQRVFHLAPFDIHVHLCHSDDGFSCYCTCGDDSLPTNADRPCETS